MERTDEAARDPEAARTGFFTYLLMGLEGGVGIGLGGFSYAGVIAAMFGADGRPRFRMGIV